MVNNFNLLTKKDKETINKHTQLLVDKIESLLKQPEHKKRFARFLKDLNNYNRRNSLKVKHKDTVWFVAVWILMKPINDLLIHTIDKSPFTKLISDLVKDLGLWDAHIKRFIDDN